MLKILGRSEKSSIHILMVRCPKEPQMIETSFATVEKMYLLLLVIRMIPVEVCLSEIATIRK